MSNVTFKIKRRLLSSGGAAGAPNSLENGELAFNEGFPVLYYAKQSSIEGIGGSDKFVTKDSSQTITGDKTFTDVVILSSATALTQPLTSSDTSVATNEFVFNAIAMIDGGYYGNPIEYIYFYGTTQSNGYYLWSDISNWYSDSAHSVQATSLPAISSYTRVLSTSNVLIDLDAQGYVNVESIQAYNSTIVVNSTLSGNFASSVYLNSTSTMTFSGNATNNI